VNGRRIQEKGERLLLFGALDRSGGLPNRVRREGIEGLGGLAHRTLGPCASDRLHGKGHSWPLGFKIIRP
jgi:hypothetical protein